MLTTMSVFQNFITASIYVFRYFCCLSCVLSTALTFVGHVYADNLSRNSLLAVYIFKLAEHVQWQNASQKKYYHFYLIDEDRYIENELNKIAQIRKLHGKEFKVTRSTGVSVPLNTEVVFVANNSIDKYNQIFLVTKNQNILIISENLRNDRNALIDLQENDQNEFSFQINKANILNRNFGLNPDIILLGGTEIDVAQLYKEGMQNLQAQSLVLKEFEKEIDSHKNRSKQLSNDLEKTKKEESRLSQQLLEAKGQIILQNDEIRYLQEKIEKERMDLKKLQVQSANIRNIINDRNKIISEAEKRQRELQSAIVDKTRVLDKKSKQIQVAAKQLEEQESVISTQKRFLILVAITGLLSILLFVLTLIAYRNKKLSHQLLEQKSMELADAKKIAEHHALAKSMFLSKMSHELRSPLNSIIGFSHLIYKNQMTPEVIKKHSGIISQSANHLLTLINDVLEMAKIEAGKVEFHEEDIDFLAMIKDVENMLQTAVQQKGLTLSFELAKSCPSYIRTDASKLRRIFINLINNAVNNTNEGGVVVRIKCEPGQDDKVNMICEVEDSGVGISPEDLETIFIPFEQLMQTRSKNTHSGTGLGLSICKELVRNMGGSINVESKLNVGSVFKFNVLVSEILNEALLSNVRVEKVFLGVKPGQKKTKALIVEDLEDNRLYLKNILVDSNCEVEIAVDGLVAIEVFKNTNPDIIFMDRRMPRMDGINAMQRIRELPGGKDTKIVAITASAFKEDQERIMEYGFDEFIRKPFLIEEIHDCLVRHLNVEFIYQYGLNDMDQGGSNQLNDIDLNQFHKEIPLATRRAFKSAVLALDIENVSDVINNISQELPELAADLQKLVDEFNFSKLQAIVDSSSDL